MYESPQWENGFSCCFFSFWLFRSVLLPKFVFYSFFNQRLTFLLSVFPWPAFPPWEPAAAAAAAALKVSADSQILMCTRKDRFQLDPWTTQCCQVWSTGLESICATRIHEMRKNIKQAFGSQRNINSDMFTIICQLCQICVWANSSSRKLASSGPEEKCRATVFLLSFWAVFAVQFFSPPAAANHKQPTVTLHAASCQLCVVVWHTKKEKEEGGIWVWD